MNLSFMSFSRIEAYPGISFPTGERTKSTSYSKPLSLTPSEVERIASTIPPELTLENPVRTPVGTWKMEERPTFYSASTQKLAEIIIPERNDRIISKIKTVARVVFQMS